MLQNRAHHEKPESVSVHHDHDCDNIGDGFGVGADLFAGLIMESLALLVIFIVCAVMLCGPIAAICAANKFNVLAVLVGALACWLGIYFFVTVYTWFRYLGLVSAGLGLWAMYKTARNLVVR
jgi:Na+/H+-translocating membrane pyrophosphatase